MTFPDLTALAFLSGTVCGVTKSFFAKYKRIEDFES